MIYLDNAATTYPKPTSVINAVSNAMKTYGANPGRSGHSMSMRSAEEIYNCRKTAANFFNADGPECVVFTLNCTHAINIVIKGLLKPGDHVVTSCLEHNAIMRPIKKLENRKVTFTQAKVYPGDNDATLESFRKCLNEKTALIACTHASNVWGIRLPIERIAAMAKQYKIPILIDAAQTAGVLPLNLKESGVDYLCTAGHKGLYGPMGTGMLITSKGETIDTLMEGGTGTNSISFLHASDMPEKFESGTPNMAGIAGLNAGMKFVKRKGMENILNHEYKLMSYLYNSMSKMESVELYIQKPVAPHFVPLISFNLKGRDSEVVSEQLNGFGVQVRAGLHCAPTAHDFKATTSRGAVRICPSAFTSQNDMNNFVNILRKIAR